MWNAKREYLDLWKLGMSVFGPEVSKTQTKCNRFHRFKAFQTAFPAKDLLLLSASMLNINKIDCRTKRSIEAHAFASSMFSKSSTAGNIAMFEDFNVNVKTVNLINTLS